MNGYKDNVLTIIHLENISNWEQLGKTLSWVNIDLIDLQDVKRLETSLTINLRYQ